MNPRTYGSREEPGCSSGRNGQHVIRFVNKLVRAISQSNTIFVQIGLPTESLTRLSTLSSRSWKKSTKKLRKLMNWSSRSIASQTKRQSNNPNWPHPSFHPRMIYMGPWRSKLILSRSLAPWWTKSPNHGQPPWILWGRGSPFLAPLFLCSSAVSKEPFSPFRHRYLAPSPLRHIGQQVIRLHRRYVAWRGHVEWLLH